MTDDEHLLQYAQSLVDGKLAAAAPPAVQAIARAYLRQHAPPPPGAPQCIWLVVQASGEKHFMTHETREGIIEWAKGLDATIAEIGRAHV